MPGAKVLTLPQLQPDALLEHARQLLLRFCWPAATFVGSGTKGSGAQNYTQDRSNGSYRSNGSLLPARLTALQLLFVFVLPPLLRLGPAVLAWAVSQPGLFQTSHVRLQPRELSLV